MMTLVTKLGEKQAVIKALEQVLAFKLASRKLAVNNPHTQYHLAKILGNPRAFLAGSQSLKECGFQKARAKHEEIQGPDRLELLSDKSLSPN